MSRASAVITCPLCPWRAKHVADTPQEVTEFLSRVLAVHAVERHPIDTYAPMSEIKKEQ